MVKEVQIANHGLDGTNLMNDKTMLYRSIKKKNLYDDLYQSKSPTKENQETKEVQEIRESEYIKIPSP